MPDLDPPLTITHTSTVQEPTACIVVVCAGGGCTQGADLVLDALRPVIRGRAHSVLVRSGCVGHDRSCREDSGGPLVRMLPCSSSQRPTGTSVLIGPVRTSADVQAVCRWLRTPDLAPVALPTRLRLRQAR